MRRCPDASRPQASRIAVVLPAPSGPIKPNISPRRTAIDMLSSARSGPYRLVTPSKTMASVDHRGISASTGMPDFRTPCLLSVVTLIR